MLQDRRLLLNIFLLYNVEEQTASSLLALSWALRSVRFVQSSCVETSANISAGPLVAGIMVNYTSWRNLLWLQVSMIGVSLVLAFCFVPASRLDKPGLALNIRGWHAVAQFNPLPTFKQMMYPNISLTVGHSPTAILIKTQLIVDV
jgi:hypothetical protein